MDFHRRSPVGAFLGLGGVIFGLGFLFSSSFISGGDGEVGELAPVLATPPEEVEVRTLTRGQTLGQLLGSAELPTSEQSSFLLAFREHANPQRIREGTEITLRWRRGDGWLRGVDVAINPDETLRVERHEFGWDAVVVETPVWTDTVYVAGEITRDLWSSVVLNEDLVEVPRQDRARLIDLMDRVFQWQVDFSRQIRQGDSYRLAFERLVRPDGTMREGRILAAELVNGNRPFHAFWYDLDEDGEGGYYDLDGESVRRAFLTKPLEYRRISSGFNRNRFHPVLEERRPHNGVDYAAATGTPVMATGDGVVTQRRWNGGYGNLVEIRHANGFLTRYAHLNGFASGFAEGDRVSQGQVIGYVGMTGMATGPHLHYEMHRNGTPMDPLSVEIPAGEPIPEDAMDGWREHRNAQFALLETMTPVFGVRMAARDLPSEVDAEESEEEE